MKFNKISILTMALIFMLPSFAYANPKTSALDISGIFISLAIESILLAFLVKSHGIKPYRFAIVWYLITLGTFIIMTLFIFGVSWLKISPDAVITILAAELLVVLTEAVIIRWLLKKSFLLKQQAEEISFKKALFYSFVINIVSFISGFIVTYLSYYLAIIFYK